MTVLVVGATSGVGRALCEKLSKNQAKICLVASDLDELKVIKSNLSTISSSKIFIICADASIPENFTGKVINFLKLNKLKPEEIYIPMGTSLPRDTYPIDFANLEKLFNVNVSSIICLLSEIRLRELHGNLRKVFFFSSVATSRGRSQNIIYSMAKRALESFSESYAHSLRETSTKIILVKLGYIRTRQSFGKRLLFPSISAETVAEKLLKLKVQKKYTSVTIPKFWRLITPIVRTVPWSIYLNLDF